MSGAQVLEFGAGPDFGKLGFSDLEKNLEQRLEMIKTLPDLEKLIKLINPLMRVERYSADEHTVLRRIRQRAYDRKRNPKFLISKSDPNLEIKISKSSKTAPDLDSKISKQLPIPNLEIQISKLSKSGPDLGFQISKSPTQDPKNLPNPTIKDEPKMREKNMETITSLPLQKNETFIQGAQRALLSINGEHFVNRAPRMLLWFSAAALVSFFLWQQSLSLYEAAGFTNSFYSAVGGILMIVGFAAYHSITRSWFALFFCLYAGAYEGYLMISGTINDDKQTAMSALDNDRELIFLQEKADKEHEKYTELKHRYDNPESKVFKNEWFSKTHLAPAWDESVKANEALIAKKASLMAMKNVEHVTWLKIFYRLGLVFLCMMLVHRFFASCLWQKHQQ